MKLFLCSHFAEVGTLLKDEVAGKNVLFVPTASIIEEYKGYVETAHKLWEEMNANIIEVEISTTSTKEIEKAFEKADILYFTGGNTFFLIDWIKKTGVDNLIERHLKAGKLYVGESGGAIICAKELSYIKPMDEVPENYSQKDYSGLGLVDFYVVPHYLCEPFTESSKEIIEKFAELNLAAITNSQAILVQNEKRTILKV